MSALFSQQDYINALRACLPRGKAWPKTQDSIQGMLLAGLVGLIEQVDSDAQDLLVDAFPISTVNLLPEWEDTLGLPDPCLGSSPTQAQRQASVAARFTAVGNANAQFYIDYAAKLGYTITVSTNVPFRIGLNRIGDPIQDWNWYFALTISGPSIDAVIECELRAIAGAEIALIFS